MTVASRPALPMPGKRLMAVVATFALFEAAWLACVLGAAHGRQWTGIAVAAVVIAMGLAVSRQRATDMALIVVAVVVGLAWDGAIAGAGLIEYAEPGPLPAPAWILALWALFAITLREPLRYLHTRLPLAALLGGIGGAVSYAAAARMGACRLVDPALALTTVAIGWAVITPSLLALVRRLDGQSAIGKA